MLALLAILGFAHEARAQNVVDVLVQGNRGVSTETILNEIYLTKGKSYSREKVSEDIKRIFQLGYFDDVQVEKIPEAGGVKLIYNVKEKPPIDDIVVEGNKKIKTPKILEAITVRRNYPPDNKKIAESKQKIQQLYEQEGYSDAVVDTETRQKGANRELVFHINEKQGNTVRKVNFEGNTVFSDGKLRRMIRTKKKNFLSFLTGSGKFREDALDADVAIITYNYLNKGYMRVRVGNPKVEYSDKEKGLVITFFIDEGQQYRVGNITFSGDVIT
ncbi:MAG: POTRA domain-containing protein, partial [bacterium]|nr:POTRA domain-containing protein [bacterium]